ncbi:AhpC/TSA family protein [Natronincola ferrireducens]|uniref:AhpC/TSA family protein n=3 Tax=Natronincola ferrireducens TaxID=393762 RepID=A0A1G9EIF7_9FIRM|nr:AhpC/TSA family protein [Natronincola ferrireducens]
MEQKTKVEIGKKAPDFTLPSDIGEEMSLNEFKGKNIVVFFYPKDHTAG